MGSRVRWLRLGEMVVEAVAVNKEGPLFLVALDLTWFVLATGPRVACPTPADWIESFNHFNLNWEIVGRPSMQQIEEMRQSWQWCISAIRRHTPWPAHLVLIFILFLFLFFRIWLQSQNSVIKKARKQALPL